MSRRGRKPGAAIHAGVALACFGGLSAAGAQDAPPSTYVDRVISAEQLPDLPPEDDEGVERGGLPRSFFAEALLSRTQRGDDSFGEFGLSFGGFRETESLGSFSLDASVVDSSDGASGRDETGGTATLWQRDLFLPGGWVLENGLGVVNTPVTSLVRSQYRFFLPGVPLAGASTDWRKAATGLQLQASLGRGGVFNGTRAVGFELAEGDVASLGAQWNWAPGWIGALTYLATDGSITPDAFGGSIVLDQQTRAALFATRWQGARDEFTINLHSSQVESDDAIGVWLDALSERGRYRHNYGAFHLEPGLAWGAMPINNDARGAYYRISYQSPRWSWNTGLDAIQSLSGLAFEGYYGNAFARYQATSRVGYGASVAVRRASNDSDYSLQAFMDRRSDWGETRVQLEQADGGATRDGSWQVSIDQALPFKQGKRLSLSVSHGSLSFEQADATRITSLSLYGGLDLTDRLSVDGSTRWNVSSGSDAYRSTDVNVNFNWRLNQHWSVIGTLFQSSSAQRSPFILDPLANAGPFISLPETRSVFVSVRYSRQAGTAAMVLGGGAGASGGGAAGSIAGSVFLDNNGDGLRTASEQPASNVVVVLDGRYSVRTDSQGNFRFPRVSVGEHSIEVIPDNLPLPWFLDEEGDRRTVEVKVRETTRADIGARRER